MLQQLLKPFLHYRGKPLMKSICFLAWEIVKELSCKPLIFQTQIIWSNRIHSLKYLRSATFGSEDIVIRKLEIVAKTQFLFPVILNLSN